MMETSNRRETQKMAETYRKIIMEMVAQIQDTKTLKRIYEYVSHFFDKAGWSGLIFFADFR